MCEDVIAEKFDFTKEVNKYYPNAEVVNTTLKDIYNLNGKRGKGTEQTRKKGVYALYYENKLKKIGKATDKNGIFHRMSQYYRGDKKGGLTQINTTNKDDIVVLCFNPDEKECWFAERRLQVIAHDCGEEMPWENTSRN